MVLTPRQSKAFRNWIIKSVSVPVLSVICLIVYWPWSEGQVFPTPFAIEFHFFAAACLLFGGFPFWNVVLEPQRLMLFVYHGLHFVATFGVFFVFDRQYFMPPPAEFCMIIGSWCLAKEGLRYLMPVTDKLIEDFLNWRQDTVNKIVQAHYHVSHSSDKSS